MHGFFDQINASTARLLEQASDEVARLDAVADLAPRGFSLACRLEALDPREETTSGEVRSLSARSLIARSLIAASVEPLHEEALPTRLRAYRDLIVEEERRVRGGVALSSARLLAAGYAVADPASLDGALKPGGQARPVLLRATTAAAAIDGGVEPGPATLGSAVAALLLCGTGVTDHLRLLPFAGLGPDVRASALDAWRSGDPEPWTTAALTEAARAARDRRLNITGALNDASEHDARLDPLGRAAITARRALEVLRDELAATIPTLATRLECSRPAASDALERLVAAGLATEVTERARDRVFALTAALEAVGIA